MEWVQSVSDRFAAFDAYGRTLPAPFEERGFQGAPLLATIAASFALHYAIFLNAMPAKLDACARSRVASLAHSIISVVCVSAWLAKHEVRLYDPEFAPRLMCVSSVVIDRPRPRLERGPARAAAHDSK